MVHLFQLSPRNSVVNDPSQPNLIQIEHFPTILAFAGECRRKAADKTAPMRKIPDLAILALTDNEDYAENWRDGYSGMFFLL